MFDAFGVVALVAMTPLFTVQIVGLVYKKRMSVLAGAEESEIKTISQELGEKQVGERWGAAEYSDASGRFDVDVDMDYAASMEWAEEVYTEEAARRASEDNEYIDFEDVEYEDYEGFVTDEDFFGEMDDDEY